MDKPRVRFAPSPTGSPHIGNIRTAVFDYLYARHTGGTFILRIEDTDRTRFQEGSLQEMMNGLRWIGMQWDEGPEVGGDFGPYFQSERLELYAKYAQQLIDEGRAYHCFCTRERLEQLREQQIVAKQPPGYDKRCRELSTDEQETLRAENPSPVIRFKMKLEGTTEFEDIVRGQVSFRNELEDDFVIIKADGFPTYHFASIIDDHFMQITHVVRGEEWIPSAPKHFQLYEALGWNPPRFVHPPLILDEKGKKLSKRSDTATTFSSYIEAGYIPDAMLNFLATMGWSSGEDRKLFTRAELIEKFSFEGIANHPAIFDLAKLDDLNGEYIRMMPLDDLAYMLKPRLQAAGFVSAEPTADELAYLLAVTGLIQDRMIKLCDAPDLVRFFYTEDTEWDEKGLTKWLAKDITTEILSKVAASLEKVEEWVEPNIDSAVRSIPEEMDIKPMEVIHRVRMAVTHRTWGPGLFELMRVIGKDRCIKRIEETARAHKP